MPRRPSPRSHAPAAKPARRAAAAPAPLAPAGRRLATLLAFGVIAALVSFPLVDPDLWQHLVTGRAIWQARGLEPTNVWTWPSYGAPYVIPSWLFRVLLWPFWSAGGVLGLFVWRWLTTLGAFALLWAAARAWREARATGLAALFVLVWCAVLYRFRSQVRPETLVAVLLAAQLALFEWRRARRAPAAGGAGFDPAWLAVAISVLWTNAHLSFPLGLAITGAYLLDELWCARRGVAGAAPGRLGLVLLASAAATLVNPYGLRLVRQPLEFALVERRQAIMQLITELGPIPWKAYLSSGLPLLLALPFLLALWRWRRHGPDFAELAILAGFTLQGISSQRFIGFTALAIAPFFARDASEFLGARAWPAGLARPAVRALLAAAVTALLLVPAFRTPPLRPRVAFRDSAAPIAACDAIARHDIRGRSFQMFSSGGYLLWRFWPDRDRLPFFDVHLTGSTELREAYFAALTDSAGWARLDRDEHFEWVLLPRAGPARGPLTEWLDADTTTWSLVFRDDVAALFVRRGGRNAAVAERFRYRWLPAGERRLSEVAARMGAEPAVFDGMIADLNRSVAESKWSATSHLMLGNLASLARHWPDALAQYDAAAAVEPNLPGLAGKRAAARDSVASGGGRR